MSRAVRALVGALALAACASDPKPIPTHLDPSNPDAPESPAIGASTALEKAASPEKAASKRYACPMHPEVQSDEPARCPKCGMKLTPVDHQHHHHGGGQ